MKRVPKKFHPILAAIIELLIGVILIAGNQWFWKDEFWNSMGLAMVLIGILQMIRCIRYQKDKTFRETVDVSNNDERNKYLALKAWSWTGVLFVNISAVAIIILKIVGQEGYMMMISGSVCLMLILYWISYSLLQKKY